MREKFSEYCEVISGFAFKSKDLLREGDIPVIKIGNISNGGDVTLDDNTQYVLDDFLAINEKYHVKKDDILISLTGSHINQPNSMVGRTCRSYCNKEYLLNQRAGKIIPKSNSNADYLYYLFSSQSIKENIVTRAYGAANQVNVSPTAIGNIKWDFPDKKQQENIGAYLKLFDELIQNNIKRIKLLEQMAENLYKEWFVRFRFPGYETMEFEVKSPKGWIFGDKEVTLIPSNWHYGELKEIGEFIRGKNITADKMIEGEVPVISAGISPSGYHNVPNVFGGCITISASGANAGYLLCHLNDIWAADCSYYQNSENLWFVYNSLKFLQPVISNMQAGAAQPHVYPKHVNRICMIIPEKKWISKYCEIVSPIYDEIKVLKKKNDNLIKQRDLLLPRLMSGKLEV